ncbi:molybdate ABC transporter substrate-binding protein [Moraxella caviae]|uniref:Molybdate ABC transporter substrate-binding protein n=1 Tax=Moraxella caviae TaxID=34060 RepID=A0A1T0A5N7_9GAMM|nr:molybdate ABC transporter substrate-binding protein [Moraxella caviae]OOR91083.1 molybdate ABC transporter substrate-binding protein [Moraxella caviae]STZ14222.1 Molybdate-binding periplasmic protein precursor [Moraxella caviae]VEW13158.1 Molybdate-binding periplasmic protein precursor [Moraxella caviae]
MNKFTVIAAFVIAALFGCTHTKTDKPSVTVYAAASLTDVMNELHSIYESKHGTAIKTNFAASGTLAKQITQGGKADVFLSADTAWAQYLHTQGKIAQNHSKALLGNRLVLITPAKNPIKTPIVMDKTFDISSAFTGKLCTGNTQSVPAGKYAKEALTHLGWWSVVSAHLVETEDVRSAVNFVSRGECALGIVYATDAQAFAGVQIVATFPKDSHTPIVYPISLINPDSQDAAHFYQFLQSAQAQAVFRKYGFDVL